MTKIEKTTNEFAENIENTFIPMWKKIEQLIRTFVKIFVEPLNDFINSEYKKAGSIYGNNQEGCLRWIKELHEIDRLRAEADDLEFHHEMLRGFKEMDYRIKSNHK